MRKRYWFGGLKALAVLAVLLACAGSAQAQVYKYLPTLTLVKNFRVGANDVTARDTQYVAEAGTGETRYFLMPVFIKNVLDSVYNPITGLSGEPIYSFRFKIQYNRTLLRAIGVQKRGPLPADTTVAAKNFNLSWDIDQDSTYKRSTIGVPAANGERIMITGSSSIPLPLPLRADAPDGSTDPVYRDTAVFMYVLFEVVGTAQLGGGGIGNRDQVILTNDTLMFNNYPATSINSASVSPSMVARGFNPNPRNQQAIAPTPVFPVNYPNNYGASVVVITNRPTINLFPAGQVRSISGDPSLFELTNPLQTQFGTTDYIFRNLLIRNNVQGAILRNVAIETDAPWLRVDTNIPSQVGGGGTAPGDRGMFIREIPTSQINLNVIANPSLLPTSNPDGYPTPGIYIGYITIRSAEASNSAVRLRVVLIVNRNPLETGLDPDIESVRSRGIQLLFRNSGPRPDSTYLTFGTGVGATDTADVLFGEISAPTAPAPGTFYARFFPPSLNSDPLFNGLLDGRGVTPTATNGESSLDIRNFKTNTTLVYCVRFSAGAPQNYPVVVEFDTRDFPNGAQLFVRDNINGQFFSTNMRQATSLGGTRRYFTIQDPNINGFCIEYTVPSVVQFPEIRTGWNLVSLPVVPSDPRSGVVFPNIASGKPTRFTQNQYVFDDTVRVGVGYFVKYGDVLDSTVAGTRVLRIHEDPLVSPFSIRVYKGWNTVGGLSVMTTTESQYLSFGPLNPSQPAPFLNGEVYRYITDRGYEQASLIVPGYGYWVKVDRDGYYRLSAPPNQLDLGKVAPSNYPYTSLNRLSINDDAQKVGTLYFGQTTAGINNSRYELPPVPGTEMFDVRFDNNGFVSASTDIAAERVVNLTGVQYPVVLTVGNADADYIVTDAVTGDVLGSFQRGEMSTVTIFNAATKSVKITGVASSEMSLGAAFPNPAASRVNFDFNVPGEQSVTITLHSTLGNEVATLFKGAAKGKQTVDFSVDGIPAGVYYYKMTTSSGFSQVRQVVIAK